MAMFSKHIADYVLGKLDPASMPEVALQALVEGYDSPSLRRLAGESYASMDPGEVIRLFHHALDDLGLAMPSVHDAARTLICYWTKAIADGLISPRSGLHHIVFDVYPTACGLDSKLDIYTLEISELHDLVSELTYLKEAWSPSAIPADELSAWDKIVIEEARTYLQNHC